MNRSHEKIALLERQALERMEHSDYLGAVAIWDSVLDADPAWEHGQAWNEIAFCLQETGDLRRAEQCYKRALSIEPWNRHWNGSYCSFAYLRGRAASAYRLYLRYYQIEAYYRNLTQEQPEALLALGAKLSITEAKVWTDYRDAVSQGSSGGLPPKEVPDAL